MTARDWSDVVDSAHAADRYRKLTAVMADRVAAVDGSGWSQPSPCAEWTARDVLGHVIEVHSWPLRATGMPVDDIPSHTEQPVAAWEAVSSRLAALLDDPD